MACVPIWHRYRLIWDLVSIQFSRGCVAHGDGLKNIYQWKNTVGPLEARKAQRNLWGIIKGALGYFEYFQFCEDILVWNRFRYWLPVFFARTLPVTV